MLSPRLLEIGTTSAHLEELLKNWRDNLRILDERFSDVSMSDETKAKFKYTRGTIKLLTEHLDAKPTQTSDTCYMHLTELYGQWQEALYLSKRFHSTTCKETTKQLEFASNLLYSYIAEDSSEYELLKLVNSAA